MVQRDWFLKYCTVPILWQSSYNDQVKEEEDETIYHCATIMMGYDLIG